MVNSLVATSNIVLYAPELDSGLRHAIESLCPEANIRCTNFALDDWLKHVGNGGDVDGVILDTDAMGLGDLKTVGATLKLQPQTWCLLLVGDRGIAGFESLLECSNASMLPKPWTPQGLRTCLMMFSQPHAIATSADDSDKFLSGLVESLRDPMTCISGVLQMSRMNSPESSDVIDPAMQAALLINEQLEYIELASSAVTAHYAEFDIHNCAIGVQKDLAKIGHQIEIDVATGSIVYSEPRCARAALKACFLLLHRFGLNSKLVLVGHKHENGASLIWQQQESADLAADTLEPPPYLEDLICRLAKKSQAEPVFEKLKEIVPNRVGLRFNS